MTRLFLPEAARESRTKHIVGFSGGIDSQATLRWVRNRFGDENAIALNSQAGRWEHDLTASFVRSYSKSVFPITEVVPLVKDIWITDGWAEKEHGLAGDQELTMELLVEIKKRSPSRTAKFCTEILKLRPQRRWTTENFQVGGQYEEWDYVRYTGVRRQESKSRENTPFVFHDKFFDCDVHCPLADWTKQMCFDYVRYHDEPVNPLYSLGFERVGCMPCIEAGKEEIARIADRFPESIDKVRALEEKTGKTFFAPKVPGLHTNTIDQCVAWSRTMRGNVDPGPFAIIVQREACESKYGLCE